MISVNYHYVRKSRLSLYLFVDPLCSSLLRQKSAGIKRPFVRCKVLTPARFDR